MARLLHRLGLASVRHRVIVTLAWLALLAAGAVGAATSRVPAPEITAAQRRALVDALTRARADGLTIEARGEALHTPGAPAGPAEGIGVIVALVVLAVTLGSLLIAGMNLLSAGVGV